MDAFWQRLDLWLRHIMPTAVALIMVLLGVVAWPLPYLGSVMPPLGFIALYYWATHRPDLFPAGAAFTVGLLTDLINGLPLGVSAFLFTVAHHIILRQRRFFAGHSFPMLWSGFALAAGVLTIAQWLAVSLTGWQIAPFAPVLAQTVLGVALFPLPCWAFILMQRAALTAV